MDENEAKELFKQTRPPKRGNTIWSPAVLDQVNIDIVDFTKVATRNKNFNYALFWIDIHSRYLMVAPLKNKKADTVLESLKDMPKPNSFTSDSGGEFKGAVKQWMDKHNIKHRTVELEDHRSLGVLDRVVRTIRDALNIVWATTGTFDWISHIDEIVKTYNKKKHRTIGARPIDVFYGKDTNKQEIHRDGLIHEFERGDKVRKLLKKNLFEKSGKQWSKAVMTVKKRQGFKLVLSDGSVVSPRDVLKTKFKVEEEVHEPKKELQQLTKEKTTKQLLKTRRYTTRKYQDWDEGEKKESHIRFVRSVVGKKGKRHLRYCGMGCVWCVFFRRHCGIFSGFFRRVFFPQGFETPDLTSCEKNNNKNPVANLRPYFCSLSPRREE